MANTPRPHTPFFLVRVSKQKEKESKSKIGSFILPETLTFMANNTQCGEIVDIGEGAAKYFPEAKVGHILMFHHFVQMNDENEARAEHLIHDDEEFNYYVVTAYGYNGKDCEAYGVWDGEKIIPNKDYVFLETEKPVNHDLPLDEAVNQNLKKSETGLFLFEQWKESREDKEEKQAELKRQVEELSKSGNHKLKTKQAILTKEWEMQAISNEINKQSYEPHTIAFANPELSEWFGRPTGAGDVLGMFNMAVGTTIKFEGVEYIVAKAKFIAYLYDKAA